ncbi:MAG: hypothetical protein HFI15_14340 [Lachnospiraceae bacterium]|jgi:hypothetical protein|nr:hypothetical protein [Lachnospiraceae bacterium]
MSDEIQPYATGEIAAAFQAPQNIHTGSGDIYSNIGTINQITYYPGTEQYFPEEVNFNYYNLFVVEKQPFTGTLAIPKKLALKESIKPEVKQLFGGFGKDEIEQICKMPSIIATRNHNGRSTGDDHYAIYGFVKKFSIQSELLVVNYSMNYQLQQQQLNQIEDALQLEYAPDTNELDRVHWTIKEVNLRKVIGI